MMKGSVIAVASTNSGKLREIKARLDPLGIAIKSQADFGLPDVPETGGTFVENALLKARALAQISGLPTLADDSGLCVSALGGAPGIYSARYAGEPSDIQANIQKLLKEMEGVTDRAASFVTVMVLMRHGNDPLPEIMTGTLPGQILTERMGSDGFGYDPIFYLSKQQKSLAELSLSDKNKISHRGQALEQVIHFLSK